MTLKFGNFKLIDSSERCALPNLSKFLKIASPFNKGCRLRAFARHWPRAQDDRRFSAVCGVGPAVQPVRRARQLPRAAAATHRVSARLRIHVRRHRILLGFSTIKHKFEVILVFFD